MGPQNLPERLDQVRERIETAAQQAGRSVDSITLLGVTKGQPASVVIARRAQAGMRDFGESYLQEALEKIDGCCAAPALDLAFHRPSAGQQDTPGGGDLCLGRTRSIV